MDYHTVVADLLIILGHIKRSILDFLPNLVAAISIFLAGLLIDFSRMFDRSQTNRTL
jgi:hypothetical protein